MKHFFLVAIFMALSIQIFGQVDNTVLFSASGQDYDASSYNLSPTRKNVISGVGRFNNSSEWPAMLFQVKFDSYLDYGRPEHLKNASDFSMSLWYGGSGKTVDDIAVLFNKFDIKLTLQSKTGPTVYGIVDEEWTANAYNAETKTYSKGYVGSPHHLVIIKKNDSIYLYRDNILRGSAKYTSASISPKDSMIMGKDFNGQIDYLTIYEGVISKEEINFLYSYNEKAPINPENCPKEIFLFPFHATFNEGDSFSFCKADYPAAEISLSTEPGGYGGLNGLIKVQYPDGTLETGSGSRISANEVGKYKITILTEQNCLLEKSFEMLPALAKPTISLADNHVCTGHESDLNVSLPLGDIIKSTEGTSITRSFKLGKDGNEIGTYTANDTKIPLKEGGLYEIIINYDGCLNGILRSDTIRIKEKNCILSTDEHNIDLVEVHPNPTSGILFIDKIANNTEVTILSASGQTSKENVQDSRLDLSNYNHGIYTIILQVNGSQVTKKIVLK